MKNLSLAVRHLLKTPGLSLVAILTLALGIGASTALFSVVYGVLLNPYPYASPGTIWTPGLRTATTVQRMRPYRVDEVEAMRRLPAFSSVMATAPGGALLAGEFAPETVTAIRVSGNAFGFLGVPPVLGRTLQPSDISPSGVPQPVVVLSFARWQRLFGGDAGVLGRTLLLDDTRHTIVGVMPARFGWWTDDGVWLPLGRTAPDLPVFPIVRLTAGTLPAAAEAQLQVLQADLARTNPQGFPQGEFSSMLTNYLDITVASGRMETSLHLLSGAVLFLLLIACANVANLQLARTAGRVREVAVRLSLGAARAQIVRQLLTESVLLGLAGGVSGLAFAYGITELMVSLMPSFYVPNEARIAIDLRALAFCTVVSVCAGVAFGLLPALQASRTDLTQALNDQSRGSAETSGGLLRRGLVVAEVAVSVILLGGAAVTARSLTALQQVKLGFDPAHVMTMQVPLPAKAYATAEARNRFAEELLARVRTLPYVEAATIGVGGFPFGGPQSPYAIPGLTPSGTDRMRLQLVGEDYLRVMGVPLRRGRMLSELDVRAAAHVAVLNESAAALWPAGTDPVGGRLTLDALQPGSPALLTPGIPSKEVTIVGIVADTRNRGLVAEPQPAVLLPYTLVAPAQRTLAIRTAAPPALIVGGVRAHVAEIDPAQPVARTLTLDEIVHQETAQPRFLVALFGLFAALGLAMSAAGLGGVLSHFVVRRTREIGIRMALGARRADIVRLIGTAAGRLVTLGLGLGLLGALGVSHLLIRQLELFGVRPDDPVTYFGIGLVLATVALGASLIPAWRAAHVQPSDAMR